MREEVAVIWTKVFFLKDFNKRPKSLFRIYGKEFVTVISLAGSLDVKRKISKIN